MPEDRDVRLTERIEQRMETQSGKGTSKLLMVAFGIVTTALLTVITYDVHEYSAREQTLLHAIAVEHDVNAGQATSIELLNARVDAIERKTDAQIEALQALTLQVTRNGDALQADKRHTRS